MANEGLEPSYELRKICPSCNSRDLEHFNGAASAAPERCYKCWGLKIFLRCTNSGCNFETEICLQCKTYKPLERKIKPRPPENDGKLFLLLPVAGIAVIVGVLIFSLFRNSLESQDFADIERLRQKFPLQKNETWYHVLSVLEQKVPMVKSITLLHESDRRTSDCLAKELVSVFSRDVKMEEVNFTLEGIEYRDYGEVLEHYYALVKRTRVLVANLDAVPSNVARVFHSLCDEVSSDVKPSLFIFLLRWDGKTEHLKPLEKATAILKRAWGDLPDSDIFPLLSRVVKNVVVVVPEKRSGC